MRRTFSREQNELRRRGIALLFVLGTLALMSVLAITFVSITRLEKKVSRNYVEQTRARMAAESGLEAAYVRLQEVAYGPMLPQHRVWMDYNPDDPSASIDHCEQPSFAVEDRPPSRRTVSGIVGSSNGKNGDYFLLQVSDASGKLNLNDPDDPVDRDDPTSEGRLHSLLRRIGDLLFHDKVDGSMPGLKIANLIMDKRAALGGRFHNYRDIHDAVVLSAAQPRGVLDEAQFRELLRHVTLYSWVDPNVLKPTFVPEVTVPAGAPPARTHPDGSMDVFLYRDLRTKGYALEPRAPVNVNSASEELLIALLEPLQGWFLEEGPIETLSGTGHYGQWNFSILYFAAFLHGYYQASDPGGDSALMDLARGAGGFYPVLRPRYSPDKVSHQMRLGRLRQTPRIADPATLADLIYNRIHDGGDLFESWDEFERFLRNDVPRGVLHDDRDIPDWVSDSQLNWYANYYHNVMVDLILANCDPNSRLNDFNPDRTRFRHLDKSQLTAYTTEFCFEPSGSFEATSLGVVEGPDGIVLSSQMLHAGFKLFDCLRLTTQAQFLDGYEEPKDLKNFFSESDGLMPTACAWVQGNGYALQSYPEPVLPNTNYITESIFDGHLALAAWTPEYKGAQFGVNFETDFAPLVHGNPRAEDKRWAGDTLWSDPGEDVFVPVVRRCMTPNAFMFSSPTILPASRPRLGALTFAAAPQDEEDTAPADPPEPGSLYPDGAFSDIEHGLAWPAGNIGFYPDKERRRYRGSLQFWIKPNFTPEMTTRVRRFFGIGPMDKWMWLDSAHEFGFYFFGNGTWTNETGAPNWQSMHPFFYGSSGGMSFWSNLNDWIPPCCFGLGYGNSKPDFDEEGNYLYRQTAAAMFSETAVADFPGKRPGQKHPQYDFTGHGWNHIALSWSTLDYSMGHPATPADAMAIHINGEPVPRDRYWAYQESDHHVDDVFKLANSDAPNYARFGAVGTEWARNFSADSTYDDIYAYASILATHDIKATVQDGRYYNESDAVYTSPPIRVADHFELFRDETLYIRSVSWTLTWPRHNARRNRWGTGYNVAPARGRETMSWDLPDPYLRYDKHRWDPVSLDLQTRDEWLYKGDPDHMPTYCGGSRIPRRMPDTNEDTALGPEGILRFRVHFNIEPLQTLLESPCFEDITFMIETAKPRILYWTFSF